MTATERLSWATSFCQNAQLRLTDTRKKILRFLSDHRLPVNIATMARAENLGSDCAETTIYRTLMLLKELAVVRQVSVRHKVRYFVLNVPGTTCVYLICRCCGSIAELPELDSVLDLERQVSSGQGYAAVCHELEVYGVCPKCQDSGKWSRPSSKLPIRAS